MIRDLSDAPQFAPVIAERCWRAWWTDTDVTLAAYRAGVEAMTLEPGIPIALVAERERRYAGSVFVIENDLTARPQYAPWIAALWVEPAFRRRGVASRLIDAALGEARRLGHDVCYLCASHKNTPFYLARGFDCLERDVGSVNVFSRRTGGAPVLQPYQKF